MGSVPLLDPGPVAGMAMWGASRGRNARAMLGRGREGKKQPSGATHFPPGVTLPILLHEKEECIHRV